jgi:hypothetical protein
LSSSNKCQASIVNPVKENDVSNGKTAKSEGKSEHPHEKRRVENQGKLEAGKVMIKIKIKIKNDKLRCKGDKKKVKESENEGIAGNIGKR